MKFSVAICTYNGERYITEQLQSILEQTVSVSEIVISDDGSTDSTVELVQDFIATNRSQREIDFLLTINSMPLGIAKNFESCISRTKHDFIFLADQDDVWDKDKVEILSGEIVRFPVTNFLCSNAILTDENNLPLGYTLFDSLSITQNEKNKLSSARAFEVLLKRNLATGATSLLHRRLFDESTPFPPDWLHDEWLAINSAATNEFRLLDQTTMSYRQHSSNSVGARKLSIRGRISKYREPRNERNQHLERRATELNMFLRKRFAESETDSASKYLALSAEYEHFQQLRQLSPTNRINRLFPVTFWLLRGYYFKFGRGIKDWVKDFLQPDIKHTGI